MRRAGPGRWAWMGCLLAGACSGDDSGERAADGADSGAADSGTVDGDDGGAVDGNDSAFCVPDESAQVPQRDGVGAWTKVELPGTQCSDGSPYKFFVNYSDSSNNLIVIFEPGGACWDYASCSGNTARGAANPDGIPDNHMDRLQHAHPHAGGLFGADGAFATWNKVFVPYCTGDVHSGSKVATYENPAGGEPLTYRHVGYDNMREVAAWLDATFVTIPRLMVTGCSAGGAGSTLNYPLLRRELSGAQCGYLLNDSGPLFPGAGPSSMVQAKTMDAFNGEELIADIASELGDAAGDVLRQDIGQIDRLLAEHYPKDRFGLSVYQRDLNFSLYSYETFFDEPTYASIFEMWEEDLSLLREEYDALPNLAYYMPFYRSDNCSHCASLIPLDHVDELIAGEWEPWAGTEIEEESVSMPDFIDALIAPRGMPESYFETSRDDGEFSEEAAAACRE